MAPATKVFKTGRVVVVLNGRYAGRKAIVVSAYDQGNRQRGFGHALVVGIEKAPMKVTKKMSAAKMARRSTVKTFLKHINYTHLMPTRYVVTDQINVKDLLADRKIETADDKKNVKRQIGEALQQKFLSAEGCKSRDMVFFRKPLRF